ncbi:MAG TPA: Stp1/IreP family PP2C-type Ser/Thr phosphatase [Candidatus Hydrogenedentes bacterium]|nr:Stp1/IreP family PP2C-type Ser/Thr phosphatase [Candidatus Hydrogenedentota bacterium]HNT87314.1 Stp1/IreP family PP2C-type Ser/Thr phosphatase [Candidatus Hydrogenedentota bacterium]
MRLDIAAQTDTGRRKTRNEDAYGVFREGMPGIRLFHEGALLCVADGLGGHTAGDIASKLAVSLIKDMLKEKPPPFPRHDNDLDERDEGPLPVMRAAIEKANDSLYQTNLDLVAQGRPMGTTVLAALVLPRKVYIANVGDSRCYHIRDGELIARTEDHSWVDEQVKQGLMSKAEAELDRRKNIVTRCVGTHPDITVDTYRWHIVPGDMLLLCSDGLVNMVRDTEITAEFRPSRTAAEIAQRLVALANENGGKDNITVIVANVSPHFFRMVYLRLRAFLRRHGFSLFWMIFLLLYGAGAGALGYFLRDLFPLLPL